MSAGTITSSTYDIQVGANILLSDTSLFSYSLNGCPAITLDLKEIISGVE
jgi:hypothetical protein